MCVIQLDPSNKKCYLVEGWGGYGQGGKEGLQIPCDHSFCNNLFLPSYEVISEHSVSFIIICHPFVQSNLYPQALQRIEKVPNSILIEL